jgi:hypothetical protein
MDKETRTKGIEIALTITKGQIQVLKDINDAKATVEKALDGILPSSFPVEANAIVASIWEQLDNLILNWKKWVIKDFNLKLSDQDILRDFQVRKKAGYWESDE